MVGQTIESDEMALTNRDRVGQGIDLLTKGLRQFVVPQLKAVYQQNWTQLFPAPVGQSQPLKPTQGPHLDAQALLHCMVSEWRNVFAKILGYSERSLVGELIDVRNNWAHQRSFSTADAYRAIDSMHRLSTAISSQQAKQLESLLRELRSELSESDSDDDSKPPPVSGEGSHRQTVLDYVERIYPDWTTNSGIGKATKIEPHQQIFQLTRQLRTEGRIEGRQVGREWHFRAMQRGERQHG